MSNHTYRLNALIAAMALAFGVSAHAQTSDSTNPANPSTTPPATAADKPVPGDRMSDAWHSMRASKLIGKEVRNAQGEKLGKIEDVVVDVNNDEIYYAVLSFGGFMGMGDKLFAYPVRVFHQGKTADSLVLNVEKQKLKDAPGFETKRWPSWNKDQYRKQVDTYYGDQVALQPKPNMLLRRASNLTGADVIDQNGKDVGDIKDLVMDMQTGKVQFAAVKFDKGWGKADQWTELPLRAFRPSTDERGKMVLRVSQEQIATAPAFPANRWPNMEGGYRSDVDAWFTGLGVDTAASSADRVPADTSAPRQQ